MQDLLIKLVDDNHLDIDNLQYYLIKDINAKINLLEIVEDIDEDVEVPDELCDPNEYTYRKTCYVTY